ncbi:MAG: hypothetical protein AAF986_08320 [Pseudomonadota bacterium]
MQRESLVYRYMKAVWAIERNRVQFYRQMIFILSFLFIGTVAIALIRFSTIANGALFFTCLLAGCLLVNAAFVFAYPKTLPYSDDKIVGMQGVMQSYFFFALLANSVLLSIVAMM